MSVYLESCTVKGIKVKDKPIEYFENKQMKALLSSPEIRNKTGRRNQMMLILYYDTAARISELLEATCSQIHLDADVPYITIFGKGRKYRNIPLMEKTVLHLKRYFSEFHPETNRELPLFYTTTYGKKHRLSNDTVENMIKKYSEKCQKNGVEMPRRPHCHMVRKTRAMDLYKNGMPLSHIQQLLGHEDMSTTSGFYAFATLDTLAKSMDAANKYTSTEEKRWNDKEILKKIYRL
jgi:site-specific recombinase XerD